MRHARDARRNVTVFFADGSAIRHHFDSIVNLVMANPRQARFLPAHCRPMTENRTVAEARRFRLVDSEMHLSIML